MDSKKDRNIYDWIVVGGGISGITSAEILTRAGHRVLLIEKNQTLCSETSKIFHEWFHSGSLYTLVPDNLTTVRYLLGATDDLLTYYDSFSSMNLSPTESGIAVNKKGWFNDTNIEYRYYKNLYNPIWLSLVSRSLNIIDLIDGHDWLRRRAGSDYGNYELRLKHWLNNISNQYKNNSDFFCKRSPDLTMNSRLIISDLLSAAIYKGLKIITDTSVENITQKENGVTIETDKHIFQSKNTVVCSPDLVAKLMNAPVKKSYAPMAIFNNVPESEKSFVELHYKLKKCINLIVKADNVGQAGGISLNKEEEVDSYLSYIISEHKKRNPSMDLVDTYVGLKKELVQKNENRNYLYHINQKSKNVWSIVLGKFSLAFSSAPEFFRRVYHDNPPKSTEVNPSKSTEVYNESLNKDLVSKTSWQEIIDNSIV